jgi:hypothetical protein
MTILKRSEEEEEEEENADLYFLDQVRQGAAHKIYILSGLKKLPLPFRREIRDPKPFDKAGLFLTPSVPTYASIRLWLIEFTSIL